MNAVTLTWTEKIARVGTHMLDNFEQAPTTLEHIFEPGVYIRRMTIPADTYFIGRPHRFGHKVVFTSGRFRLITEHNSQVLDAPYEMFTQPGHIVVLHTETPLVAHTEHLNPGECRDTELMESLIFHAASEVRQISEAVERRLLGVG